MEFKTFRENLQKNFNQMVAHVENMFEVDVDKDELWNLYLDSFPEGTNLIYRERREYDCSCCRHFVKAIGNAVIIKGGVVHTIWDFNAGSETFQAVADALSAYVKSKAISDVYISKFKNIGTNSNKEMLADGTVTTWEHLFVSLPDALVNKSNKSEGELKGTYRDTKNVFKRSLDEISEESVLTVLELISQNSLYKGLEWKPALDAFLKYKVAYDKLTNSTEKGLYAWEYSIQAGMAVGRIRNHSMGTLLVDISDGMDLDTAVKKYETMVAPANYKRPKAIFTKKMLEDAKKTISELGYMDSLARRYATLDDITVNNILFSNKDVAKRIEGADVFAEMAKGMPVNQKKFSKVEEISAECFVNNILPTAKEVEVLLENKHASNMVSLIAPENKESPSMFKWGNGFSWAYTGNITDSAMKEHVKSAGGKVDGVLRFSIQWNDGKDYNPNDFDAHCMQPNGNEIFYAKCNDYSTTGMLDVDIRYPERGKVAVENITWTNRDKMRPGKYQFFVHNFSHNGGRSGFKAEIEFDGQVFTFEYDKELRQGEKIQVAEVVFDRVTGFSVTEKLPSTTSSREVWAVHTNQFVPVSVVMFSPNYWDEQYGIGNKHYFFMLKDCVNPEKPNGFYNEFLKQELVNHKRVFEALGGKMAVKETEDQLSGIGFSSTKRNDLIVKVKGQSERVLKIKF